ncbi:MAG: VPLPA-CTERM sorting domain-containing protein [Syntrophales bacterium]
MKKKIFLAAICMVFLLGSICQADYTVNYGPAGQQFGDGGVFQISGSANYTTYCVETGEFITIGSSYPGTIDSNVFYGTSASGNHQPNLQPQTVSLWTYYLDNISNVALTNGDRAQIQEAIWYFQGQLTYTPSGNSYTTDPTYTGYVSPNSYDVGVLNLWASVGTEYTTTGERQSMLWAAPAPIPAAVWLLGTGLLGLVGIRRRIRK